MQWDQDDQDKALAWMLDQRMRCPSCGTYPEDWLNEEGYPADPDPYEVISQACRGCQILDEERRHIPDDVKGVNLFFSKPGIHKRHDRAEFESDLEMGYDG